MQGIEILNQTDIYYVSDSVIKIGACAFILMVFSIAMIFLFVNLDVYKWVFPLSLFIFFASIISFLTILIYSEKHKTKYDHTEYQITISDDVNFYEFSTKYEVLNQQGRIYTVREKMH